MCRIFFISPLVTTIDFYLLIKALNKQLGVETTKLCLGSFVQVNRSNADAANNREPMESITQQESYPNAFWQHGSNWQWHADWYGEFDFEDCRKEQWQNTWVSVLVKQQLEAFRQAGGWLEAHREVAEEVVSRLQMDAIFSVWLCWADVWKKLDKAEASPCRAWIKKSAIKQVKSSQL